jgi:hypothetical protein
VTSAGKERGTVSDRQSITMRARNDAAAPYVLPSQRPLSSQRPPLSPRAWAPAVGLPGSRSRSRSRSATPRAPTCALIAERPASLLPAPPRARPATPPLHWQGRQAGAGSRRASQSRSLAHNATNSAPAAGQQHARRALSRRAPRGPVESVDEIECCPSYTTGRAGPPRPASPRPRPPRAACLARRGAAAPESGECRASSARPSRALARDELASPSAGRARAGRVGAVSARFSALGSLSLGEGERESCRARVRPNTPFRQARPRRARAPRGVAREREMTDHAQPRRA